MAIGTKAARCVQAAEGRKLLDFSLRRTHGADAGLTVARSSYAAGFDATSNVLAGERWGIPISGTMADGEPLLEPVMIDGRRLARRESLETIRERFRTDRARMNPAHLRLKEPEPYPVRLGRVLKELQEEVIQEVREKELGES